MSTTEDKIIDAARLAEVSAQLHAAGRRIVTCNGSFDLFHYGHLYFLEFARAQGDALIVGVNADCSVKQYKSAHRPIVPERQRARLVAALTVVEYVYIFPELVPMPFLEIVKPQVHVNGAEYGAECIEAPTVRKYGGQIVLVPKVEGLSTTALIARIKACAQ
jgi:rfaE bifunctional protein nucleotidyltransferase chain/domain